MHCDILSESYDSFIVSKHVPKVWDHVIRKYIDVFECLSREIYINSA